MSLDQKMPVNTKSMKTIPCAVNGALSRTYQQTKDGTKHGAK